MKIKLFNGGNIFINLTLVNGGYDQETSRVMLVVQGEGGQAGTMTLDIGEATKLADLIKTCVPSVKRVTGDIDEPAKR